MTDEESFLAEKATFEYRCDKAREAIIGHLIEIDKLTNEDLKYLQEIEQTHVHRKLEFKNPEVIELLEQHHQQRRDSLLKGNARIIKIAWEGMLDVVRLVWGQDALDFALEAVKREAKAN